MLLNVCSLNFETSIFHPTEESFMYGPYCLSMNSAFELLAMLDAARQREESNASFPIQSKGGYANFFTRSSFSVHAENYLVREAMRKMCIGQVIFWLTGFVEAHINRRDWVGALLPTDQLRSRDGEQNQLTFTLTLTHYASQSHARLRVWVGQIDTSVIQFNHVDSGAGTLLFDISGEKDVVDFIARYLPNAKDALDVNGVSVWKA